MLSYILMRIVRMIPQILLISILAFIIIQLPPGDYLEQHLNRLRESGREIDEAEIRRWEEMYGLDKPMYVQYAKWIWNIVTKFDFGYTFQWNKPVKEVIMSRMWLTFLIALGSALFTWVVAIPIGIFVAVKQYSAFDYFFTFLGFIGLAVPGFLLAMVLMYVAYTKFGIKVGGLFSPEYQLQGWSWAKVVDMLKHMWLPVILLGIGGTASMIRTLRATMLDELRKQYVTVARAKGLSEIAVLVKYPVRLAINPIISGIMWLLPWLFSGGTVVEIVMNLPTAGPALWRALMGQDMYLAGSYILITGTLTTLGSLLSDILLAVIDPRIRFGAVEAA
ncbi:MAG TPA: ABC transporter permease [Chloroflexi bacterium]|nr:ABC transporter permease [Chloroflexota bacterium]